MTALARKTSLGERGPIGGTIALASYFGADAGVVLVQWCMLDGTNKNDGFGVRARRKPQRYPKVSRGFATPPWRQRRVFMFQIACITALAPALRDLFNASQL
jgi:hypothetical protein